MRLPTSTILYTTTGQNKIMLLNIDVGVMINELITSGEKGAEYSSKSSTIVM